MGKRILNPNNKWLWIAGGVVVLGGTWLYVSRKKKEELPKKAKEPTNVKVVATHADAEKLKDIINEAPSVTVWTRSNIAEDVLAHIKEIAKANGGITFYALQEPAAPHLLEEEELVALVASGREGQKRFSMAIEGVAPVDGVNAAIGEAVVAVMEPPQRLGGAQEAPSVGDLVEMP